MRGGADGTLPKIEVANTMPNSWLVSPSGEVVKIEPTDQQVAGKIMDLADEMQKKAGKALSYKKYEKYEKYLQETDTAVDSGALKDAIKALKKVEREERHLTDALKKQVDGRFQAINAKAMEQFEQIKSGDAAAAVKAANKLKSEVGSRFKRGYLPVVEAIKTWLKEARSKAKAS
jgi:hypothetical protein